MEAALAPSELVELFPKYFTLALIGVRNSGKSVLIQQIIKALIKAKKVDIVIVMSGSAGLNDDYDFLPPTTLMKFNDSMLHKIWDKQVLDKQQDKTKHVFIVFDDCLSNKEAIRNEVMNRIWVQGRHIHISSAILSQYPAYILSPTIMGNSDLLLWSKLNRQATEKLWQATVGISCKEFIRISEAIGGVDYTFMIINNYCKSPDPMEYLNYVRAEFEQKKKQKKERNKISDGNPDNK
jgi:hypothetical protein